MIPEGCQPSKICCSAVSHWHILIFIRSTLGSDLKHLTWRYLKDQGTIGTGMSWNVGIDFYFIQIRQPKPKIWQKSEGKIAFYPRKWRDVSAFEVASWPNLNFPPEPCSKRHDIKSLDTCCYGAWEIVCTLWLSIEGAAYTCNYPGLILTTNWI